MFWDIHQYVYIYIFIMHVCLRKIILYKHVLIHSYMSILYFQGCVCVCVRVSNPAYKGVFFFSHPEFWLQKIRASVFNVFFWTKSVLKVGWWFQMFLIFTNLTNVFQMGKSWSLWSWSWSQAVGVPNVRLEDFGVSQEAEEVVVFCVFGRVGFEWHGSWMSEFQPMEIQILMI